MILKRKFIKTLKKYCDFLPGMEYKKARKLIESLEPEKQANFIKEIEEFVETREEIERALTGDTHSVSLVNPPKPLAKVHRS